MTLSPRQRQIVRHLWNEGPLSRWELHQRTGQTPNGVGVQAEALLKLCILRERAAEPSGGGRPRVPLEIDPQRRNVVGLAIAPGRVEAARLGLRGDPAGEPQARPIANSNRIVATAGALLRSMIDADTLGVGMSVTGFVDPDARRILFSSAVPGQGVVSLQGIYDEAAGHPVVLENDMHALAAHWQLTHRAEADQDVLLVFIEDGRLGAAMLIGGRPNRGCAIAGNELGHNRFFVETEPCYCGHTGCLERICSSDFLRRCGAPAGAVLNDLAANFQGSDRAVGEMLRYLSMGLANAVNFVRPDRLVLVSGLTRFAPLTDALVSATRTLILPQLADRVRIDLWAPPGDGAAGAAAAHTAAWLALASLFGDGWFTVEPIGAARTTAKRQVRRKRAAS